MPFDAANTIHPLANAEQIDLYVFELLEKDSAADIHRIRSKPIKFSIGCGNAEFYLQPKLLSRLSAPLDALIRNGVDGSDGFCVTWDIDVDIFLRLVQFAFTGSYTYLLGNTNQNIGRHIAQVWAILRPRFQVALLPQLLWAWGENVVWKAPCGFGSSRSQSL